MTAVNYCNNIKEKQNFRGKTGTTTVNYFRNTALINVVTTVINREVIY